MDTHNALSFKTRMTSFTTVSVNPQNLLELELALSKKMQAAPKDFFQTVPFVADLQQATHLTSDTLEQLKQTFQHHGLLLVGLTNHNLDPDLLLKTGLAHIATSVAPIQAPQNNPISNDTSQTRPALSSLLENLSSKTKVLKHHIRSGQRIYAPEGDLVIIGLVGAGAEVIADGNIFILGALRGRAFAGAKGENDAFIYCNELNAELISIAGNYQTMEQLDLHKGKTNCLITLEKDETMTIKAL